jgi:glycosyltransferase involved in cell wall biosynthesis
MVVAGFPQPHDPCTGIFNLHAAKALRGTVDLSVIRLRAWKPNRRAIEVSEHDNIPLVTVTAPQVPRLTTLNIVLYRLLAPAGVAELFRDYDLIHSVDAVSTGIIASAWAQRAGIHHVTQIVGSDLNSTLPRIHQSRGVAGWESHIHGVACNSLNLQHAFARMYPGVPNIRTVYRGTDLQRYNPQGDAFGRLEHTPPVRFLFLGGFPPYPELPHAANTKGGETLLAAWREAEGKLASSGATLTIAGPESNGEKVVKWQAALRYPELVNLAGAIAPSMVPSHIRSSDVVLVPSMEEGLPNVAVESSACGRAVFGSHVGGIPEVVCDGETGLLLPAGDVPAWRNALMQYAGRFDELKQMGERARQRMETLFDARSYADRMIELYEAARRVPLSNPNKD